jgi:hypothetical protein
VVDRQSQSRPLDTKASTFTALCIRTGGSARSTRSPRTRWPPARSPVSSACGERARYALSEIVRYPARALNAAVDVMADAEGEIGRICTTSDYLHSGTRSRSHRSRQRSSGRSSPLAWPSPMARARQVRAEQTSKTPSAAAHPMLFSVIRTTDKRASSGSQIGSQQPQFSGNTGPWSAIINAADRPIERHQATRSNSPTVPSKQRVAGSNPAGRTSVLSL